MSNFSNTGIVIIISGTTGNSGKRIFSSCSLMILEEAKLSTCLSFLFFPLFFFLSMTIFSKIETSV